MIKVLLKNPQFMIGFSFILLLLVASIVHALFFDSYIPNVKLIFDEEGNLVASSPFPPSLYPPFGTNTAGDSMFYIVLMGAKYTIGIAIVVAALRMFISVVAGLFYGNYLMKANRYLSKIIDAFHYLPMALLVYLILKTVLMSNGFYQTFEYSYAERVIFELIILTVVALPTTTLLVGNETNHVLKQEFITGAEVMGASRFHIIKKHIMPHLEPKLWIQFAQQVVQVLVLLIHLGVLRLLFGGTDVIFDPTGRTFYLSLNGEWSGLIGINYRHFDASPWLLLAPLVAFACTILAMNLILEGLKSSLDQKEAVQVRRKKKKRPPITTQVPENPSFEPIHTNQQLKG